MRERYGDISGGSGIREYEIGDDFIRVWFADGKGYEYNFIKPGQPHIDEMKRLAAQGRGLTTYISKHVTRFARRLPAAAAANDA